jgi:hypothetical protein
MHGLSGMSLARRMRTLALYLLAFAGTVALASIPALSHDSLHTIYERTIVYQSQRESPFSAWGLYGWHGAERVVEVAAVVAAIALALVPRRSDLVALAAACGAVMLLVELGLEHWFYLYIPWFFGLVIVALLGSLSDPSDPAPVVASAPARSSLPATVASS